MLFQCLKSLLVTAGATILFAISFTATQAKGDTSQEESLIHKRHVASEEEKNKDLNKVLKSEISEDINQERKSTQESDKSFLSGRQIWLNLDNKISKLEKEQDTLKSETLYKEFLKLKLRFDMQSNQIRLSSMKEEVIAAQHLKQLRAQLHQKRGLFLGGIKNDF